jgi:predicted nucleotidyltransferase
MDRKLEQRIVSLFKPLSPNKIILFGSVARGDTDEYSDIDVIVVYRSRKRYLDRLGELYELWDIPKAVDILTYTPEEFAQMLQESYFLQDAVKDGRTIYEGT